MGHFQEDPLILKVHVLLNYDSAKWITFASDSPKITSCKVHCPLFFWEPSHISQSQTIHWVISLHSQIPLLPILACICQGSPSNNITSHLYCRHAFQDNLPMSSLLTSKIYCCVTDMIIQCFQHHLLKKVSCRLPFLGICAWGQDLSAWEVGWKCCALILRHCQTQTAKREMGVFNCDIVMRHLDPINTVPTVESSKLAFADIFHISDGFLLAAREPHRSKVYLAQSWSQEGLFATNVLLAAT